MTANSKTSSPSRRISRTAIAGAHARAARSQAGPEPGLQPHRRSGFLPAISPCPCAFPRPQGRRSHCDIEARGRARSRLCARLGTAVQCPLLCQANLSASKMRFARVTWTEARLLAQSILDRAEKAAREAIRLDPRLAMGYAALAPVEVSRGNWVASEDDISPGAGAGPQRPGYSV